MTEKIKVGIPVIVEGKYDKNALLQILDANVITTDGFSVFNVKEKQDLIRRLAEKRGVILLTDPDGGGVQIRSFLLGILPREKVIQLYVPKIAGKEKRKRKPSKSGTLGVEGMNADLLRELFRPFSGESPIARGKLTKTDFYLDGLSGCPDASEKRAKLADFFSLPTDLTAGALLEAVNLLFTKDDYERAKAELFGEKKAPDTPPFDHTADGKTYG